MRWCYIAAVGADGALELGGRWRPVPHVDAGWRARLHLFGNAAAKRKSLHSDTDLHEGAEP